jgi:hypothetical protein
VLLHEDAPKVLTLQLMGPRGAPHVARHGVLPTVLFEQLVMTDMHVCSAGKQTGSMHIELQVYQYGHGSESAPSAPSAPPLDLLEEQANRMAPEGVPGVPEGKVDLLVNIMKTVNSEQTIQLMKIARLPPALENPQRSLVYLKARCLISCTHHSIHQTHHAHQQAAFPHATLHVC